MDELPAEAVAVLLLNGSRDKNCDVVRQETEVFHDFCGVYGGGNAAFLVGTAAPADECFSLKSLIWVELPVVPKADAHRIDVTVERDQSRTVAQKAEAVALSVDLHLIEADLFHLFGNSFYDQFFFAAFTRYLYHIPEERGHVFLIALCCL